MEKLQSLLGDTLGQFGLLKEAMKESGMSLEERKRRNERLRGRLDAMKGQVQKDMDALFSQLGIANLSEEEIDKHLTDAFNKFDEDGSGQLGQWEFQQAWFFLGLKGSEGEIQDAYKGVDTNNSGLIDLDEFKTAIKSERLMELNLSQVLGKLGVELGNNAAKFESFKATETRRRLMKQQYEENVAKTTKEIIQKLAVMSSVDVPTRDPQKERMYNTLRDTFNAFDSDGSGELGYPEYVEAWKFLNRPGDEAEIKKTFDSVDVDGTQTVEWAEFAFTLMGDSALEFGPLADLELLNTLLNDTAGLLSSLKGDLAAMGEDNAERAKRNAELRARMQGMRGEMAKNMGNMFSKMMGIMGKSPEDLLTEEQIQKLLSETYKNFDVDNSNQLEYPEFKKAWEFLGLQGSEDEVRNAFNSVDRDGSGVVDRVEFCEAIKGSRMAELSLSVLLTQM